MSEEYPREIAIGDTTHRITRFKGLKASIAGALVSRVMRELPQFQERAGTFRREFREKNTVMITPAMAKLPRFEGLGLTDKDFEVSGGKIEFPEEPDGSAFIVHIFPDLFELADKEVRKFLAILVIPNSELEDADDADEVDEVLAKWGRRLMHEGDIDELLELAVVGLDVFKEQLARKRDRLGKIPIPFLQTLLGPPPEEPQERNGHGQTPETQTETDQLQSPSLVPDSSTDSPPDSDGTVEPLFTESPGTS